MRMSPHWAKAVLWEKMAGSPREVTFSSGTFSIIRNGPIPYITIALWTAFSRSGTAYP